MRSGTKCNQSEGRDINCDSRHQKLFLAITEANLSFA